MTSQYQDSYEKYTDMNNYKFPSSYQYTEGQYQNNLQEETPYEFKQMIKNKEVREVNAGFTGYMMVDENNLQKQRKWEVGALEPTYLIQENETLNKQAQNAFSYEQYRSPSKYANYSYQQQAAPLAYQSYIQQAPYQPIQSYQPITQYQENLSYIQQPQQIYQSGLQNFGYYDQPAITYQQSPVQYQPVEQLYNPVQYVPQQQYIPQQIPQYQQYQVQQTIPQQTFVGQQTQFTQQQPQLTQIDLRRSFAGHPLENQIAYGHPTYSNDKYDFIPIISGGNAQQNINLLGNQYPLTQTQGLQQTQRTSQNNANIYQNATSQQPAVQNLQYQGYQYAQQVQQGNNFGYQAQIQQNLGQVQQTSQGSQFLGQNLRSSLQNQGFIGNDQSRRIGQNINRTRDQYDSLSKFNQL